MNNRSIPVALVEDDPELAKVFLGMAVYNHGRITIAYRVPMKMTISVGNTELMMYPFAVEARSRVVLNMEPLRP